MAEIFQIAYGIASLLVISAHERAAAYQSHSGEQS
jgi:hypothetical protein